MTDIISKENRSKLMSKIKSKNTSIEIKVRRWLFSNGFRYRINVRELPGKPDIVLKKYKCAIFVHGCFWHGHDCPDGHLPKSNIEFWKNKIDTNKVQDFKNMTELEKSGWHLIVIWECDLKKFDSRMELLANEIYCCNKK